MSWFKRKHKPEKRNPCKIIVHFDDLAGRKFDKEIVVPDGYTFKSGFAQYPRLFNRNGEIARIYNWKGGFEITYEFLYD